MADANDRQAGLLILRDLELFNRAAMYFEEKITPVISEAVGEVVRQWAESRGWKGKGFDDPENQNLWIAPPNWYNTENRYRAKFGFTSKKDSADYWLANLFSAGDTEIGFKFLIDYANFGHKRSWDNFVGTSGRNIRDQLDKRGWVQDTNNVFFRKLRLPADRLAKAWEDEDWAPALEPLGQALDALAIDVQIFDALMADAEAAIS